VRSRKSKPTEQRRYRDGARLPSLGSRPARRVSTTKTRTSTLKSTAQNARMGKLRVDHLHTHAEHARALAQALLEAADKTSRSEVTIRSQSSTTRVSTLNRPDDYVDCDGRGLTTKFAKSRVGGAVTMPIGGMQNRLRRIPRPSRSSWTQARQLSGDRQRSGLEPAPYSRSGGGS